MSSLFALTEDHNMIAAAARELGLRFGLDYWREHDANGSFPTEFWQAVCEAGMCGVALPKEQGGLGFGMLEMALIVENLAAAAGGATIGQLFMINPIFAGSVGFEIRQRMDAVRNTAPAHFRETELLHGTD